MLFKTVYGPELESVYFLLEEVGPMKQEELINSFVCAVSDSNASLANIKDAISFLKTAGIISYEKQEYRAVYKNLDSIGFKVNLIRHMRTLKKSRSKLDSYYVGFIDTIYIKPNIIFNNNLHNKINSIDLPSACSEEKVNAWRRVLEYLGLGYRGYAGLAIIYDINIVSRIICNWDEIEGPLQLFLEDHFSQYLPWSTQKGEIAMALEFPLLKLEEQGKISLHTKQDMPYKGYLGKRKVKWITKESG